MYRDMKLNVKTGMIILAFSILITAAFIGAMLWYGTTINQMDSETEGIYKLSSTDYLQIIENGGNLKINADHVMNSDRYNSKLMNEMLHKLIPISIIFLTILIILSVCLWSFLKHMQNTKMIKIAKQLNIAAAGTIVSDEPALAAVYDGLKQKFDNHINDYKRLNAYLTHEQKNEIAILRTRMELSENFKHIGALDKITDSIDDILTLSENVDASPLAIVDISLICAEVFDNYYKIAKNIVFDFEGNEDTEILAKSRWVYRAVANLLDNAIKYGEGNPIILSVRAKHSSVIVSVSDHGIGIEETKQETIFNNCYRINELGKDGYGIGLSLVSHVCDLCGGFVTVDSTPGIGSTFYLSFPQNLL